MTRGTDGYYRKPSYFTRGLDVLRGDPRGLQTIVCVCPNETEARTIRDLLRGETGLAYDDGANDIERRVRDALGLP